MTHEQKTKSYEKHCSHDDERGHNVDGCFYCGGNHPSDCCTSPDRNEYWESRRFSSDFEEEPYQIGQGLED